MSMRTPTREEARQALQSVCGSAHPCSLAPHKLAKYIDHLEKALDKANATLSVRIARCRKCED